VKNVFIPGCYQPLPELFFTQATQRQVFGAGVIPERELNDARFLVFAYVSAGLKTCSRTLYFFLN
jgi:hypothetical protein